MWFYNVNYIVHPEDTMESWSWMNKLDAGSTISFKLRTVAIVYELFQL